MLCAPLHVICLLVHVYVYGVLHLVNSSNNRHLLIYFSFMSIIFEMYLSRLTITNINLNNTNTQTSTYVVNTKTQNVLYLHQQRQIHKMCYTYTVSTDSFEALRSATGEFLAEGGLLPLFFILLAETVFLYGLAELDTLEFRIKLPVSVVSLLF